MLLPSRLTQAPGPLHSCPLFTFRLTPSSLPSFCSDVTAMDQMFVSPTFHVEDPNHNSMTLESAALRGDQSRVREGGPSVGVGAPMRKHHRAPSTPRHCRAGSLLSHLQPAEPSQVNTPVFKPPGLRCSILQPELREAAAPTGPTHTHTQPHGCSFFPNTCGVLSVHYCWPHTHHLGQSRSLMMSRQCFLGAYYVGPVCGSPGTVTSSCPRKTLDTGAQERRPPAKITGPGGAEPGSGRERSGRLGKLWKVKPGAAREGTDTMTAEDPRRPCSLQPCVTGAWPTNGPQAAR